MIKKQTLWKHSELTISQILLLATQTMMYLDMPARPKDLTVVHEHEIAHL